MLSAVGVIPARFGSSRLPGKPLADLEGQPLLFHVFRRASRAQTLKQVIIATDDQRVFDAAKSFGAEVMMSTREHRSGTDRIAEVIEQIKCDVVVNIQGDEPLIDPVAIDHTVHMLSRDHDAEMSTLKTPIQEPDDLWNPNIVKVVTDRNDYAVYFSRAPIPYPRAKEFPNADLKSLIDDRSDLLKHFFRHIGLYCYRRDFLRRFSQWAPTHLEMTEDLEQLRALEHGTKIKVEVSRAATFGVDTPEDLERIRKLVHNNPDILNG